MNYMIRQAKDDDFPAILAIYDNARRFMAEHGNATQWGTNSPSIQQTKEDIVKKQLFVLTDEGRIRGVFAMIPGEDPTYQEIYSGAWNFNTPYAAIHRLAGDGSGGIVDAVMEYTFFQYDYIRIDTHEHNLPMRRALQRVGFAYCGIILTDDGTPRLAFDLKR